MLDGMRFLGLMFKVATIVDGKIHIPVIIDVEDGSGNKLVLPAAPVDAA